MSSTPSGGFDLALFPLRTVLFPAGLLSLKVFEARYLDLVSECLRESKPFGVVALRQGPEVQGPNEQVVFEDVGTVAELIDVDSAQAGILNVRCRGMQRFRRGTTTQQSGGLWTASVTTEPEDEHVVPDAGLIPTVRGLINAITKLKAQGAQPFLEPFRYDDAGWVANRWCEILPISLAAKQKLLELPDPRVRLQLVHEFLKSKGVVDK